MMNTKNTAAAAQCLLARPWYRVHPTHRYARMVDRGVTSVRAWEHVAARLLAQADASTGQASTFCRDRAYDAYQRAGWTAQQAWCGTRA